MGKRNSKLRYACLERDNYFCQKCFRKEQLEAHHIIALVDGGEDVLENLITLCAACHREWDLFEMSEISWELWLHLPPASFVMRLLYKPPPELKTAIDSMFVPQFLTYLNHIMRERRSLSTKNLT